MPIQCYTGDMVSFRRRDKEDRNKRILKFHEEHPNYTHDAIAKIFHIHRSRVSKILKKLKVEVS